MHRVITINVYPSPPMLSANSLVSLLSLYGMWPLLFFGSPSAAMQFPIELEGKSRDQYTIDIASTSQLNYDEFAQAEHAVVNFLLQT